MTAKNKYATFFAILKQINATGAGRTKEDIVKEFTNERTASLSDLSATELGLLEKSMSSMVSGNRYKAPVQTIFGSSLKEKQNDKKRKKIIAIFKSIGSDVKGAKAWAEKYGVDGIKLPFNDYSGKHLSKLIASAEKVKESHINSVNKQLLNTL